MKTIAVRWKVTVFAIGIYYRILQYPATKISKAYLIPFPQYIAFIQIDRFYILACQDMSPYGTHLKIFAHILLY